ncbi:hypothetical protein HNO89_002831 [Sporosarcina luteola]|nr:hypothetical protein [Sporosarcina luteola]
MNEQSSFREIRSAVYNDQEIIDFKGNPLIEALPPILSPEEAYEKLSYYPPYDVEEANLPTHIRYHALSRYTFYSV